MLHNQCMKAPDSGLGSHLLSLLRHCPVMKSLGLRMQTDRVQVLDLSLPTCVTLDNILDGVKARYGVSASLSSLPGGRSYSTIGPLSPCTA